MGHLVASNRAILSGKSSLTKVDSDPYSVSTYAPFLALVSATYMSLRSSCRSSFRDSRIPDSTGFSFLVLGNP